MRHFGMVLMLAAAGLLAVASASELPEVLATVGGSKITAAEIRSELAPKLRQLENQRHELFEKAVEAAVDRKLLELEAEARGLATEELLELEVTAQLSEPTDEEVDAFYRANESQIAGPKEEASGQIRAYLLHQQRLRRRAELMAALRSKYPVQILLEDFRPPEDAAGSPADGPPDAN